MKRYWVYVHTCPNGKRYVGATTLPPLRRWNKGRGYINGQPFHKAVLEFGWTNIVHQAWEVESEEEMHFLEKILICIFQSTNPEHGYNRGPGGKTNKGIVHTEEWKKQHSEQMKGKHPWNYGKKMSEEFCKKNSESHKGVKRGPYKKNKT